jgi:surface antigen
MIIERIKHIASNYVGVTELPNNRGWKDKTFEAKMKATGWSSGQAWCAYFAELVWFEAYKGNPLQSSVTALFSPSATATFANFQGSKLFKTGTTPRPGALVVWRFGFGWRGHIGIVARVNANGTFVAIEGNTNTAGSREGIAVMNRTRRTNEPVKASGLNLIGFVYPA